MNPWKLAAFAIIGLFLAAGLARSCGYGEPIILPNWADSLANVRDNYTMDSVYWAEQHEADSLRAETFKASAEEWRRRSLASRPTRPPRVGTIPPDSGMDNNVDVMPDSVSDITHLRAVNDSLWAALDLADSAYAFLNDAYQAQRRATADAMAGWARADTALADQAKVGRLAIADLTARLRKAERGCRVLGLLPCPAIGPSYSANVGADGRVRTGPGIAVVIPIKIGGS